jgi:hypothetical protein
MQQAPCQFGNNVMNQRFRGNTIARSGGEEPNACATAQILGSSSVAATGKWSDAIAASAE